MIREAIEKIQELAQPIIKEIEGNTYQLYGTESAQIRPEIDLVTTLRLQSLDALVKLIRTEGLSTGDIPLYVTLPSHMLVNCFTQPAEKYRQARLFRYEVNATDVPGWDSKVQMGFDEAIIALRTRFQDSSDLQYVLKLLSEISTGAKVTYNDNGIATTVVTTKGVALQGADTIRPIVTLKPYRTFQEIEQPSSIFLIRVSERGITFTEADGGMWKLEARKLIKAFLEESLLGEIKDGRVVVAL